MSNDEVTESIDRINAELRSLARDSSASANTRRAQLRKQRETLLKQKEDADEDAALVADIDLKEAEAAAHQVALENTIADARTFYGACDGAKVAFGNVGKFLKQAGESEKDGFTCNATARQALSSLLSKAPDNGDQSIMFEQALKLLLGNAGSRLFTGFRDPAASTPEQVASSAMDSLKNELERAARQKPILAEALAKLREDLP